MLLGFVKNKEVQKFVSSMDSIDRDVCASCLGGKTIAIEVIRRIKSDSNNGIQLPLFLITEIEKFSFRNYYREFKKLSREKTISIKRKILVTNDKKIYIQAEMAIIKLQATMILGNGKLFGKKMKCH